MSPNKNKKPTQCRLFVIKNTNFWWAPLDLNQLPTDYESAALTNSAIVPTHKKIIITQKVVVWLVFFAVAVNNTFSLRLGSAKMPVAIS